MTRHLINKIKSKISSIVFIMTMIVAIVISQSNISYADTTYPTDASGSDNRVSVNTEAAEAKIPITCGILTTDMTVLPTKAFTYTIKPIQLMDSGETSSNNGTSKTADGKDTNGATVPVSDCPELKVSNSSYSSFFASAWKKTQVDITKDANDIITNITINADGEYTLLQYASSINIVSTSSGNTLIKGSMFPYAGEYVYELSEDDQADTETSNISYSDAKYHIHIYVANVDKDADSDSTELYIAGISAIRLTDYDTPGATEKAHGEWTKVNATKNSGYGGADTETNQVTFINLHQAGTQLEIQKHVAGDWADKTKEFTMNVTLTFPTGTADGKTYTAYLYDYDTDSATWVKDSSNTSYTFTSASLSATAQIKLKHNQKIWFVNPDSITKGILPNNTTYQVEEVGEKGYKASAIVASNGQAAVDSKSNASATAGTNFSLTAYNADDTANTDPTICGSNFKQTSTTQDGCLNYVNITNTYKEITPTGIIIGNLPYVMAIAVILLALGIYIFSKRYRARF